MNRLTPRQHRFVLEYLVDLNATQAAIRAGYSAKTAYSQGQRLLKNVEVAAAIQAGMDKRAKRTEITQDYVLTGIRNIAERCAHANEDFNALAALKGYELLGKHLALFVDRQQVTGNMEYKDITAGTLEERIKALEQELGYADAVDAMEHGKKELAPEK